MESDTNLRQRREESQEVRPAREEMDFFKELTTNEIIDEAVNLVRLVIDSEKPGQLLDLVVSSEQVLFNGRIFIRLIVWFESDDNSNFAGARIWQKGYATGNVLGDPDTSLGKEETLPYQLVTVAERSPVTLLFELTGEEVVIGAEAINSKGVGAGIESMLTQSITLS